MKKSTLLILFIFPILTLQFSCNENSKQQEQEEIVGIRSNVDKQSQLLKSSISEFNFILSIDHSRLAEDAGVYTPPSIVSFFSNPKVNSELIRINPLMVLIYPIKYCVILNLTQQKQALAIQRQPLFSKDMGLWKMT